MGEKKGELVSDILDELFGYCIDELRELERNGQPEQFLQAAPTVIKLLMEYYS